MESREDLSFDERDSARFSSSSVYEVTARSLLLFENELDREPP